MVLAFACTDLFHKLAGVSKAVGYCNIEGETVEIDGGGPEAVHTSYFLEVYLRKRLLGVELVCGSESCLQHASGRTEDCCSAGAFSERIVEIHMRQGLEVDVCPSDEGCKLPGGDGIVDIRVAVSGEFRSLALEFLCKTRHYRNHYKFLPWNAHLLCPVVLGNGSEHLLR